MQTSDDVSDIFTALAAAQAALTNIVKSAENPFHKSKYAPLDAVLDIVRPVMKEHDLSIFQGTVHGRLAEGENGVTMYLQTRILHKSGQWIADDGVPLLLRAKSKEGKPIDPTMQSLGSAVSYARRYGLQAALSIASTDKAGDSEDDDAEAAQREWAGPLPKTSLTEAGRLLASKINQAESVEELHQVQIDMMPVIEQLQHDLPTWYYGAQEDDGEVLGVRNTIIARRKELEKAAETIEDIV